MLANLEMFPYTLKSALVYYWTDIMFPINFKHPWQKRYLSPINSTRFSARLADIWVWPLLKDEHSRSGGFKKQKQIVNSKNLIDYVFFFPESKYRYSLSWRLVARDVSPSMHLWAYINSVYTKVTFRRQGASTHCQNRAVQMKTL